MSTGGRWGGGGRELEGSRLYVPGNFSAGSACSAHVHVMASCKFPETVLLFICHGEPPPSRMPEGGPQEKGSGRTPAREEVLLPERREEKRRSITTSVFMIWVGQGRHGSRCSGWRSRQA